MYTIKSDSYFTKEELLEIANYLEEKYQTNHISHTWDERSGIPGDIIFPAQNLMERSFIYANKDNYEDRYLDVKETNPPEGTTAAQNYKTAYLMCLDILESHGILVRQVSKCRILVRQVSKDPSKFENFCRSVC